MLPLDQAHRFVRILLGKYMERELVPPFIGVAAESGALWKGCGFDTVIVDEGQDFGKHEWAIEKHAVKFDLGRPYRCTPGIQALADAYVGGRTGEGGESARGLKEKDGREPLELHSTVTLKEESG